jgi:hypothetical protein
MPPAVLVAVPERVGVLAAKIPFAAAGAEVVAGATAERGAAAERGACVAWHWKFENRGRPTAPFNHADLIAA